MFAKRLIDITASLLLLVFLSPLILMLGLIVAITSRGPIFFRQVRVGRGGNPFVLYKFRSMRVSDSGPLITAAGDIRVTTIGAILRKTKLDEIPQLWNVLLGEMSLVGPRPEVPKYVDLFPKEFAIIHQVRPGITDLASIKYFDEERLLGASPNPEETYIGRVLPDKLRINIEYVRNRNTLMDCLIVSRTMARVFRISSQ